MNKFAAIVMLLLAGIPCGAQDQTESVPDAVAGDVKALREMVREDRTAIDSLVMYPEELRNAIFETSANPELLAKLARMQRTSSASFRRIVSCVTPAEQRMAWDIARYPGLAGDLMDASSDFQQVLIRYPTAVHSAAMALATRRESCDVLANLHSLQVGVDQAYESLMADYPKATRASIELLFPRPEILSLLIENMDQAVLIGNIYRKDAAYVRKRASEIEKTVTEKNSRSEEDWKLLLAAHPMALGELTQAASAFAANQKRDASSRETGTLTAPAYSFWFGYPEGASWYGYPDYFLWGFYYDTDGSVTLVSLPSARFVEWLDPAAYPQLADAILKQYRSHMGFTGGFYAAVHARIQAMKEAPVAPVNDTARNLAEGLKLAKPTDVQRDYKATDYWMSSNYQAIKQAGEIGGVPKQ